MNRQAGGDPACLIGVFMLKSLSVVGLLSLITFFASLVLFEVPTPTFKAVSQAQAAKGAKRDLNVSEWNIFGVYDPEGMVINDKSSVGAVRLNRDLYGIFFESTNKESYFIAEDGSGEQKLYPSAGFVPGLGEVLEVRRRNVLINHNGVLKILEFTDASKDSNLETLTEDQFIESSDGAEGGLLQLGLRYVVDASGVRGYRVTESASRLKRQYGLQNGDVILSIGGFPLGGKDQNALALKSLVDSSGEQVTVVRSNRRMILGARD